MNRPLSPHLSIWKWRPAMAVSIFHRISGHALALAGLLLFAWWLLAASASEEAYAAFASVAGSPLGWIVWVGLSWMAFQHLLSGIRHLLMDSGWGYEPAKAHGTATMVFVGALLLTAAFWALFFFGPSIR
ncbi:MAG: succinate dehydrogenase, cytochrome b556 subunit [Sphingomonadaceae bacterium]